MTDDAAPIQAAWEGPFGWPGFETSGALRPIPQQPGVYLQTFEYQGGYLIYAAGLTRRPVPKRFREHTGKYLNGEYNVLDLASAQQGVRKEVWHGWGYARKHREEFEARKTTIVSAVREQLAGFRVFIAGVGNERRVPERFEASIMLALYRQPPPICDIPDRGMQLAARWPSEQLIIVHNTCTDILHGLPPLLEI